jgi:nucleoside-diphosphate-sugar epimerase
VSARQILVHHCRVWVLITGGAGYIGSHLTGTLLAEGHEVTVLDALLFGGDSLLGFMAHPGFKFRKLDVTTDDVAPFVRDTQIVYHLAALVGFPACQAAGETTSYRFNFDATRRVFDAAERAGVERFIFSSTYSNYGIAHNAEPVTEESALSPQSI